jgi:hypothetical protein
MAAWKPMGIHVVELIVDNKTGGAPTQTDTKAWKDKYKLDDVAVLSDPYALLVTPDSDGSFGTPYSIAIDPRTMKVAYVQQGFSGNYSDLEALAKKNQGN